MVNSMKTINISLPEALLVSTFWVSRLISKCVGARKTQPPRQKTFWELPLTRSGLA